MFMHIDGNVISPLNYMTSITTLHYPEQEITFNRDEISGTTKNVWIVSQTAAVSYLQDTIGRNDRYSYIFLWAQDRNFYPLIRGKKTNNYYQDTDRNIIESSQSIFLESDYVLDLFGATSLNDYFIEKPTPIKINYRKPSGIGDAILDPYVATGCEFYIDNVKYVFYSCSFVGPLSPDIIDTFKYLYTLTLTCPKINQLTACSVVDDYSYLPAGNRQIVLTYDRQFSVNKTLRGRQTYHAPVVARLLQGLKHQFGSNLIEITLANSFNSKALAYIRCDLSNKTDETILYIKIKEETPLYATLVFNVGMLFIHNVQTVSPSLYIPETDFSEFKSNVIANAAFGAAMIGGGLLSGLGQGLGQYAQTRASLEMQRRQLDWYRQSQLTDLDSRKSLQQSMFDFQERQQRMGFDYDLRKQTYAYQQQALLQQKGFSQQDKYQAAQNQFTKELVEANTDADLRRARNAQQLAGYRTDGAVSGLSQGSGRGGLGHPDAPVGAQLMPRSVSTQTNSPTIYTTRPSGYYTGPLSNRENF